MARRSAGRRRALGGVPHSARRLGAERAEDRGQPDRPVLVPRKRRRPSQRAAASQAAAATACGPRRRRPGTARRSCACRSRASPTAATARRARRIGPCRRRLRDALQNRYVGAYLLYGAGAGWRSPAGDGAIRSFTPCAFAGDAARGRADPLPAWRRSHRGARKQCGGRRQRWQGPALHGVRLGAAAETADRYTRANAAQGETRSHGFFYRESSETDGLIGLPIVGGASRLAPASHAPPLPCSSCATTPSSSPSSARSTRNRRGQPRRRMPRIVRGLVRQLASAVPARPHLCAAGL